MLLALAFTCPTLFLPIAEVGPMGPGLASMLGGDSLDGAMGLIFLTLLAAGAGVLFLVSRLSRPQKTFMQYASSGWCAKLRAFSNDWGKRT